jgi:transposase-like protein
VELAAGEPDELAGLPRLLECPRTHGSEFVVSDIPTKDCGRAYEMLPEAAWQRCYVHFCVRLTTCHGKPTTTACRSSGGSRSAGLAEALKDLSAGSLVGRRLSHALRLVWRRTSRDLTFFSCPRHHKHLKSTNMLERLNEEIKRGPGW